MRHSNVTAGIFATITLIIIAAMTWLVVGGREKSYPVDGSKENAQAPIAEFPQNIAAGPDWIIGEDVGCWVVNPKMNLVVIRGDDEHSSRTAIVNLNSTSIYLGNDCNTERTVWALKKSDVIGFIGE